MTNAGEIRRCAILLNSGDVATLLSGTRLAPVESADIFSCGLTRKLVCARSSAVHLPYPYGHETTGYEVSDLAATLAKAKAAGVQVLVPPYTADQRTAALVQFPGAYIAEIHSFSTK